MRSDVAESPASRGECHFELCIVSRSQEARASKARCERSDGVCVRLDVDRTYLWAGSGRRARESRLSAYPCSWDRGGRGLPRLAAMRHTISRTRSNVESAHATKLCEACSSAGCLCTLDSPGFHELRRPPLCIVASLRSRRARNSGHWRAGKRTIALRLPRMHWPRVLGSLVGRLCCDCCVATLAQIRAPAAGFAR